MDISSIVLDAKEIINGNAPDLVARFLDQYIGTKLALALSGKLLADAAFLSYVYMITRYVPTTDSGVVRGTLAGLLAQFKVNYLIPMNDMRFLTTDERGEVDRDKVMSGFKRANVSRARGAIRQFRLTMKGEGRWRLAHNVATKFMLYVLGKVMYYLYNNVGALRLSAALPGLIESYARTF
jgi:hypothetical protein